MLRVGLFTGFVKENQGFRFYNLNQPTEVMLLLSEKNLNIGWATATLTRLDDEKEGEPERYLFVITGEMRNTDMKIESLGEDRITVGNRWGKPPVLCEGVAAKLIWNDVASGKLRCWALDESGNRRQEIPVTSSTLETKPEYKTIWYEIEVRR
jgi:hypothetical protein